MSLFPADRLFVSLSPDSVAVARIRGRFRPRLIERHVVKKEDPLKALPDALQALAKGRLDVSVVLSNRYVRYATVPYDPQISGLEESLAMARFHFSRIHGERARGWDIRISDAPTGASRLACAIDGDVVPKLRTALEAFPGIRLVSLQPYLMAAFNHWRASIAGKEMWLVLPEAQNLCIAYVGPAGWLAATSVAGETTDADLALALQRARMRLEGAMPVAFIQGPAAPSITGWAVSRLASPSFRGFSNESDGTWDMALCAA